MCLCKNLHFMVCNTKLLSTSLRVVAHWRCVTVRRRRAARGKDTAKVSKEAMNWCPYTFLKLKYPHYKIGCSKCRVTRVRQCTRNELFSVVSPLISIFVYSKDKPTAVTSASQHGGLHYPES